MITRVFGLFACLFLTNAALGLETVTLKAGYNLRESAGGTVLRTNQRQQQVVVMDRPRGSKWVQVCVGAQDAACTGGQPRWVWYRGLSGPRQSAEFERKPVPLPPKRDVTPPADGTDAGTEATCTGDCKRGKNGINRKVDPILNAVEPRGGPGTTLNKRRFNRRCDKFIDKKGVGEWGKIMIAATHRVAHDCFYNRDLFGSLCPNYTDLEQPQKEAVVAMAFAAMAQVESTCNPKAQAVGTNDTADGIFQLEYSAEQRDDANRDEKWCRTNKTVDTQAWDFQSECTASIVKDRVCKVGAYFFGPSTYWLKLKSHGGEISQLIGQTTRASGLCKD